MLRSSWTMLPKNSSDLALVGRPQVVVEIRKQIHHRLAGLAATRTPSHWPVKLVISASDFGSASMRRTCFSSTAGSLSLPCAARSISSSSGTLLHRKNDSREASARSLMR